VRHRDTVALPQAGSAQRKRSRFDGGGEGWTVEGLAGPVVDKAG
jgi:hypothetical protein